MSERIPKGKLAKMPGIVEAAAISPISTSDDPKLRAKSVRVGLLDIVELNMANRPISDRKINEVEAR